MSDDIRDRLPGDLKRIAELCGVDAALTIGRKFGGTYLYVPKLDVFYRELRDQKIRREYDTGKFTARELAAKYRLSLRMVFYILGIEPEKETSLLPFK